MQSQYYVQSPHQNNAGTQNAMKLALGGAFVALVYRSQMAQEIGKSSYKGSDS